MGFCNKCNLKSSLFCRKHRKYVYLCCDVVEHAKCPISTYIEWVKNQQGTQNLDLECPVCHEKFDTDDFTMDTVRLECLHVVHINCLEKYGNSQPANTALAGYICPQANCKKQLIPTQKTDTIFYQTLEGILRSQAWSKQFYSNSNSDLQSISSAHSTPSVSSNSQLQNISQISSTPSVSIPSQPPITQPQFSAGHSQLSGPTSPKGGGGNVGGVSYTGNASAFSRKAKSGYKNDDYEDSDDNKYRRRGLMQLLLALGLVTPGYGGHVLNSKRLLLGFLAISILLLFWVVIKADFNQQPATSA